jgi:hypothetical protein
MINVVWEFVVKEEARGQFELAYGPGGAWSKLFASRAGFRGTVLLRDTADLHRYLRIETWDTWDQRESILAEREAEFAYLETKLGDWCKSRTEVGTFRVLAEAAVRPGRRTRRGSARDARRRSRRTMA